MSIRDLLDDGTVPSEWKKIAVSNLRALTSTIGDLVINNDLDITGDLLVGGDLAIAGDTNAEQIYAADGIRLGLNDAAHNLGFYIFLQELAVTLGPDINGGVATNKVYYTKVGRVVTLTFVSGANDGIFTVVGPVGAIPFANLGAIGARLLTDLVYEVGVDASGNFKSPVGGLVVPTYIDISRSAEAFNFITTVGALAANNNFTNFSITFVSAVEG